MLSKQFAYLLFGIITLLSLLFGINLYFNYQSKQNSEEKINTIITKFEKKFKADSLYLVKANKMLIDKISQKIIDSVSTSYEDKLITILAENKKYKELLIANNIELTTPHKNTIPVIAKHHITSSKSSVSKTTPTKFNVISHKQLSKNLKNENKRKNTTLNVTTYSKKAQNKHSNVTTYSKIAQNKATNVVTYSNLNKINNAIYSSGHTKNNKAKIKQAIRTNKNLKTNSKSLRFINNTPITNHNNYLLDHAKNIHNIDQAPIFPGCENIPIKKEQENCFATKISRYLLDHFNSSSFKNPKLKKGLNKVRVLFIIDKNGYTKFGKLTGQWPDEIYKEAKRVIESTPKMIPGKSQFKNISVKYSLLIPFIKN